MQKEFLMLHTSSQNASYLNTTLNLLFKAFIFLFQIQPLSPSPFIQIIFLCHCANNFGSSIQ